MAEHGTMGPLVHYQHGQAIRRIAVVGPAIGMLLADLQMFRPELHEGVIPRGSADAVRPAVSSPSVSYAGLAPETVRDV